MRSDADIEQTLRKALPADLHAAIPALAHLLDDVVTGVRSPEEAEDNLIARPELADALRALYGRQIATGPALISFGIGSQMGDVTTGDIAGGSMIKLHVDMRQGAFVSGSTIHGNVIGRQIFLDRDNRRRMLKQVRTSWIAGVLEQSLYRELIITLGLQSIPQAVSFTASRLVARRDQESHTLPVGTTIVQVYQEANQRLLILGAPGSGKTTTLLDLTRVLLNEAERDETRPIPVIFNLASWAQQCQPLEQWLVLELHDQYGLSRRFAQQWLQSNTFLPLLDGLDEVVESQRGGCVAAINTFLDEHGSEGIVVCSRIADYEAIGDRLSLDAAVQVQPLDDIQIATYLDWAGEPLDGVRAVLTQDADLRDLVRSPLLLNILALAYQGHYPQDLVGLQAGAQHGKLFDHYLQRMFVRLTRIDPKLYTPVQTLRWLHWLAGCLAQDNLTIFQIELMQPWWLRHWWLRAFYIICSALGLMVGGVMLEALFGLVFGLGLESLFWKWPTSVAKAHILGLSAQGDGLMIGLGVALVVGLGVALVVGLGVALVVGLFQQASTQRHRWLATAGGLLTIGLTYLPWALLISDWQQRILLWSFSGITLGLITGVLIQRGEIRPTEGLRWSWHSLRRRWFLGLVGGLVGGLGIGLGIGLGVGLVSGLGIGLVVGLVIGLGIGLGIGLIVALIGGVVQAELQAKARPNQGIWRSLWRGLGIGLGVGLIIGLIVVLVFWLVFGLDGGLGGGLVFGLVAALVFGPAASLYFGGMAFVQHFALRLVCALSDYIPWAYPYFLDYAVERILLRRVGGSYIFVHRLLMEHVASLTDDDIARLSTAITVEYRG